MVMQIEHLVCLQRLIFEHVFPVIAVVCHQLRFSFFFPFPVMIIYELQFLHLKILLMLNIVSYRVLLHCKSLRK